MTLDAWIAIAVVATIFPLMTVSRLGPDIILLGAVIVLMTLGVIRASSGVKRLFQQWAVYGRFYVRAGG